MSILAVFDSRDSSVEPHAVAGLALVLSYIVYGGFQAWASMGKDYSSAAYAAGAAVLIASISGAGWIKGKTTIPEPPPTPGPEGTQ